MLGALLLPHPDSKPLALETRKRRQVANSIAPPAGEREHRIYKAFRDKHGSLWRGRCGACGVYNCFGHVFAARRTAIYDEQNEVANILRDDGFRQLKPSERTCAGDIVLYRDTQKLDVIHVAQIVEVLQGNPSTGLMPQMFALSKWNDVMGEDVHALVDVPYESMGFKYRIELWTERA